ncbi:hypothetical protein [Bradyrhizobium prioriisuperbiae]|uniref:hypothetical protein n=1 Tax=Bradyrhizobium prioriisuperbiae TaxID=2854389 RepID=UPI0028E6489B|nr:hypothetical protein [Bradyrhizobium prioritasuperba]
MSVPFGLIAWGTVAALYIWPALRGLELSDAVRPLLVLHSFRYVGLAFLVPGVVSPDLPAAFARPAAIGDVVAALLALLALLGLGNAAGTALVWMFNIWGSADLLYAFYIGGRLVGARKLEAAYFGATYFIPTFYVPLLLITHGLIFWILLNVASH